MNSPFIYFSPFEQFIITPVIPANLFILGQQLNIMSLPAIDFTISNVTVIFFIIFSVATLVIKVIKSPINGTFYAMPTSLESHFHLGYLAIQATLQKHVHVKYYQQVVFPITFALAIFLLLLNLAGNFPIFMSLTSQFAVISAFSLPSIFGIFFWLAYDRELTFFRSFHAPGMSRTLGVALFPIELLTYVMRPVSIICRLCANIMSGHVIMKVILQSLFSLPGVKAFSFVASFWVGVILSFLFPLLLLELAVSVIQVYVFLVMFCMFLADTFGHHYRH
jgi:F-type H+-transporting ATPase subunit a